MNEVINQQRVYLNGEFKPMSESQISTQDRGFLFGDGVYEVIPVYQRTLFCFEEHLQRLKNSLQATGILNPHTDDEWRQLLQTLVKMHDWPDQYLYLQVTRGIQMQRDHLPADCLQPTVYAYTNPLNPVADSIIENGIKVITLEDIRWLRCDIKAITLLPNVMMKQAAKQHGVDDAILMTREGYVAEGTASNAFIVKDNTLITPPKSQQILPGITRMVIESLAKTYPITLHERQIQQSELETADEIWLTSSTKEALPVTQLNGKEVGTGKPGAVWQTMRHIFQQHKQAFVTNNPNI